MIKQRLFENVGGNQFRLLTESIEDKPSQIREGLKKVFSNGNGKITYKFVENIGLGYIKDISEARKCALKEARLIAEEFGYADDSNTAQFVKEQGVDTEPYDPKAKKEEKREVQIGNAILEIAHHAMVTKDSNSDSWSKVVALAEELVKMHSKI